MFEIVLQSFHHTVETIPRKSTWVSLRHGLRAICPCTHCTVTVEDMTNSTSAYMHKIQHILIARTPENKLLNIAIHLTFTC